MFVTKLQTKRFDIFVASEEGADGFDYLYGGTRCMAPSASDDDVRQELLRLQRDESALKNALINVAIAQGALSGLDAVRLPAGFLGSRVGGARCILRPADQGAFGAIADSSGNDFEAMLHPVFAQIGDYLNRDAGRIKLTPDFGRFAGLADLLYRHTPHVLGIRCEDGGCGGKSSYSTTGVIAAFEELGCHQVRTPVTLIGSAGAMGSGFLHYLVDGSFPAAAVCDLAYDREENAVAAPQGVMHLQSAEGRFTRDCLARGGTVVATTVGRELEHSPWWVVPDTTVLLLAHNLAVPAGEEGVHLMRELQQRGVKAYPGQVLTLGGALTSRLEWFYRQSHPGQPFDKPLAHSVVRAVVTFLVRRIERATRHDGVTPLEAMFRIAAEDAR
jgi:hypothetical protein